MSSSKLAAWFQGLLGGKSAPAPTAPGTPVVELGNAAVSAVEGAVCDALCLAAGTPAAPRAHASDANALGRPLHELRPGTDANVVDAALGLALTGRRVAAWVHGHNLPAVHERLLAAVGRRAPLVLHAELDAVARGMRTDATGHDGYHALADTGAFLALAANAQEAVDLTLIARRVAELSLTPGVVAMDGLETARALQDLLMPEAGTLRALLGSPDDEVDSATPAQRMLFGEKRPRLPAWFSAERPAALGGALTHAEAGAAVAGQQVFFAQHVAALIKQASEELSRITGRPMARIRRHKLKDARHVLVAQGSLVELAEAVADAARAQGRDVGVVGITWLRPFPVEELREALDHVAEVTVLERSSDALAMCPPLAREVRAALAGLRARVTHARVGAAGEPVTVAQLLSACHDGMPENARGGAPLTAAKSSYPKREAALQALQKAYPQLDKEVLASGKTVDVRGGARTLLVCRRAEGADDAVLSAMVNVIPGKAVRARWTQVDVDGWVARITAGDTAREPGDDVAADLVVVDGMDGMAAVPPPSMRDGATVVALAVSTGSIPARWRDALAARKARVLAASDAGKLTGAVMKALLNGDAVQPRVMGETAAVVPEPWLSVGATPAGAAALAQRGGGRTLFPVIDVAKCTGCGQCWTACPDSAIGALALRTEALLTAAAEKSGVKSPQADKLKRSYKQVAQRVDGLLSDRNARVVDAAVVRDGFEAFLPKLGVSGDDEKATHAAFDAMLDKLGSALPLSVTDFFFARPNAAARGTGESLLLAVDERSCQGCGGCAAVCGEQAIQMAAPDKNVMAREVGRWKQWETLPDTTGETIARVSALKEVGPLAGALLSRHCQGAMVGGDATEPGSGERIAMRQLVAVVEHQVQRALREQAAKVEELSGRVAEKLQSVMAAALPATDLEALSTALAAEPGKRVQLSNVLARIERTPVSPQLDAASARRLASCAIALQAMHQRWTRGADGLGRARMAVVADASSTGKWLAGFPGTSLFAPVLVESASAAPAVAAGMAQGLLDNAVAEYREMRRAELAVEAPSDIELALQQLGALTWRDLPAEVMEAVPPLLLVTRADALGPSGMAALAELLGSGVPVKVVLMDRLDPSSVAGDPVLLALSLRKVFVVSTSIAHGAHFHGGVRAALAFRGPALVHVYAPSPLADGFKPEATVARARTAVDARLHPLLKYDPAAPGVFGTRLLLDGNPDKAASADGWFKDADNPVAKAWLAERAERWSVLQELAGVVSPFTESIRAEARTAAETEFKARAAALEAEHAARVAELEQGHRARVAAELKASLLKLVAQAPRAGVIRDNGGSAS